MSDLVHATDADGTFISEAWLNTFKPAVIKNFPNGLAQKSVVSYSVITTPEARARGRLDGGVPVAVAILGHTQAFPAERIVGFPFGGPSG